MGLDHELTYTSGEQIPHADALSRLNFDEDESDNDRVCFGIKKIYFQSDLVTQAEIKTELGTNRHFQDIMKRIKRGNWKQCSEAEKGFEKQKDALTIHNGVTFRGVVPFIPPKQRHLLLAIAHGTHLRKNAIDSSVRTVAWWPGITQNVQHFVRELSNEQAEPGKNSLCVARSRSLGTAPHGLGKPQLDGRIRHLEAYDGHQLTLLGSHSCDVAWNGSRLTQKQLAVVQSDKEFGLLGRDLLPKHGVTNITAEHLPEMKSYKSM